MKLLLRELLYRICNKTRFLFGYFNSLILGKLTYSKFKPTKSFCLFIGYGRTGHTLIAALLNAHSNMVIGIEWDTLNRVRLGYRSRDQIFYSLLKNSQKFSKKNKNIWSGYSYDVINSWQGKYQKIIVIGDKSGGLNTSQLSNDYNLLEKVEGIIKIHPKLIHVIRNPFDIITTTTIRTYERDFLSITPQTIDLLPFIQKFFKSVKIIQKLKDEDKYEIFDLYHEKFVSSPKENLKKLIEFLGEQADDQYLENCHAIVYKYPHKSRTMIAWDDKLIKYVENESKKYSFLKHYTYKN